MVDRIPHDDVFRDVTLYLQAGKGRSEGCGMGIIDTDGGNPQQNQLVLQGRGRKLFIEYVLGRIGGDSTLRPTIVEDETATLISRYVQATDTDVVDAIVLRLDDNR